MILTKREAVALALERVQPRHKRVKMEREARSKALQSIAPTEEAIVRDAQRKLAVCLRGVGDEVALEILVALGTFLDEVRWPQNANKS